MKSVIVSIKPYWVFLIIAKTMGWNVDKEKTIEVRKSFPKDEDWNKVVKIYCTKDRQSFAKIPKEYQPFMERLLGMLIGEFVCDKIDEFHEWQLSPQGKYQKAEQHDLDIFLCESCLTLEQVMKYRENLPYFKPLYGWHISDLVIYDKPKDLSEFGMTRAFQSWGYVEGLKL